MSKSAFASASRVCTMRTWSRVGCKGFSDGKGRNEVDKAMEDFRRMIAAWWWYTPIYLINLGRRYRTLNSFI